MTFNPVQGFQTVSAVPLPRRTIKPLQSLQPMSFGDRKYQIDDPTKLNSMADVLFNKRARQRAFAIATGGETLGEDPISWIAGSVVAGIKHIENTFVDPIASGDMMQLVGNSWNAAMEDLDVVANPFKGMVIEPGNSSDSLVLGALAAVAAAGLMYVTGGTFGVILQSGLLAGGATTVGSAVLTDPEAAARGFVKGLGSTDIGRYRYDYDTGNVLLNLFGEIVTDPLNMLSFGTGVVRESAQTLARTADDVVPLAAKVGADFVQAPIRTHEMLKFFGDLDRKVTMAALMANPIGASLGAIGIGKKIFRNTVMSKNAASIVEAAVSPGIKSLLELNEVVEVARGTTVDLISKSRNEFLLELGVLGSTSNEQYLDAVNAMTKHISETMGGTLESNMETLSMFMQDMIYSAPGDYSFIMKYGDGELGANLLKIWDDSTKTVVMEFDEALGKTVPRTYHISPGFAHAYMKNGYVVGTSAVDAYFKGVMEHASTWGAVRNGLMLEFGDIDAQIKTLLKVDDANQVPLGDYLSAFFQAFTKRFPEFMDQDPHKLVGKTLFEQIYRKYIAETGITFEEFVDYHRMYAAGEPLLRADYAQNVVEPEGTGAVKQLALNLSGESDPTVSVALDSLPVNYTQDIYPHSGEPILDETQQAVSDLVAEDADPEVVVNAFRSVLGDEVVDEIIGPVAPTKGTTKKLLAHMLGTQFDTVRLFDKMLEVMPRILHPQITSAYLIAQNDPEVKEITGFLMDMSKMPRKALIEWANAQFPAGTPNELKARIVNLIYDYSVVRGMAEHPEILSKPDMFVQGAILPEEFDKAANPAQERRLNNLAKSKVNIKRGSLLAYNRFRGVSIDSLTEDFRKIGLENHPILATLRNINLINVSLYVRELATFQLWKSGYHRASTNKSFNSAIMVQNQMRPEVADMINTLMDESTPLGKLFNLMVFMQTGSDIQFNVFHNAQTLYTAIMGGGSYFKFLQNLNNIYGLKTPMSPNQSLVLSMEQPVIVESSVNAEGVETVKLTPIAKNKKTWKLSQIYRTASFNATLKNKKGEVQIVDMSKLNILDAATSEILLRRVKELDQMIDTVKASINVDVAVFEDEVREMYNVVQGLSAEIDGIRQAIRDLDSKQSGALRTIYNALDNITVGRDKMNQILNERRASLDDKLGTIVSEIEDIDEAITELHVEADALFRKEMSSWVQKYINDDYYSPLKKLYARMADQMANENDAELDDSLQKMQNVSPMAEKIINTIGEQIGEPFANTFMPMPFVTDFAFQSSVGTKTRNDDAVKAFKKGSKNATDPGANVSDVASKYKLKGIRKPNLIFKYNNRPTHRRFGYGFTFPSVSSGDIMTLGATGFFRSFADELPVETYVRWYLQKVAEHTRNGIDPVSADYKALGNMLKHFKSSFWKQHTATFSAIFLYYKLTRLNPELAEDFLKQIDTLNTNILKDKKVEGATVEAEQYMSGEVAMYKFLEDSAKKSPNSVFARVYVTIMTNSDTVERQMVAESRNMVFRALLKSGDIHKLYQYSEADLIQMFGDEYAYSYYIRVIRELYAVLFRHTYPAEGIDIGKTIYWDQSALRAFIYNHPELDAGDIYDLVYRTIDPDYDTLLILNHEYRQGIGFDNSLLNSKTDDLFILPGTDPNHPFARVRKFIYTPRARQEWSTQAQLVEALEEDKALIPGKTRHPDGVYTEGTASEIQKVIVDGEQLTQKVDPLTDPSRTYNTQIINVKAEESDYKGMKQPQLFKGEAPRTWATDLGYEQQKLLMDFRSAMKEVFPRRQAYMKYGFSARDLFSSSFYVAQAVRRITNRLTTSSHVAAPFGQPASATSDALIVPIPGYPLNVVADPTLRSVDISRPLTKDQENEKLAQTILDDATRIYKHNLEVYGTFMAKYGTLLSGLRGPRGFLAYKPGTKVVFDGLHGTIVTPEQSTVLKQKFDEAYESYEQDVEDLKELQWLEDNQVVEYKGQVFEYPLDIYADAAGGYGDSAPDGISSPRGLETPEEAMDDKLEVDEYFVSVSGNDFALNEHRRASEYINVLKSTNVINEKYELLDPENDESIMALHSDFLYDFSSTKVHESIRYTPISDTREAVVRQLEKLGKVSEGFERAVTNLTLQNLGRVNRIIRQYKNRGVPVADLRVAAQVAMYESMAKYDPKKGTLSKYLDSVIKYAVLRELRETGYHMGSDTETTDRLQRFNRIASRLGIDSRDFYTVKQGLEDRISKYESSKQTFAEFKAANLQAATKHEAYLAGPSDEERAFETAKETVLASMRHMIKERVKTISTIYDKLGQAYENLATLEADETLERYPLESRDTLKDKMVEFTNSKLSLQGVQDILGMTTIDPDEARGWYMDLSKAKRAVDDEASKLETEDWRIKTDLNRYTQDIKNYQEEYAGLGAYIKTATSVNEWAMRNAVDRYQWLSREIQILSAKVDAIQTYMKSDARSQALNAAQSAYDEAMKSFRKYVSKSLLPEYKPGVVTYGFVDPALDKTRKNLVAEIERLTEELQRESSVTKAVVDPVSNIMLSNQYKMTIDLTGTAEPGARVRSLMWHERKRLLKEFDRLKPARKSGFTPSGFEYKREDKVIVHLDKPRTDVLSATHMNKAGKSSVVIKAWGKETEIQVGDYFRIPYSAVGNRQLHGTWGKVLAIIEHPYDSPKFAHGIYQVEFEYTDREFNPETKMFSMTPKLDYEVIRNTDRVYPAKWGSVLRMEKALLGELNRYQGKANIDTIVGLIKQARRDVIGIRNEVIKYYNMDMKKGVLSFPATPLDIMTASPTKAQEPTAVAKQAVETPIEATTSSEPVNMLTEEAVQASKAHMKLPSVFNINTSKDIMGHPGYVYIGRSGKGVKSALGNPYSVQEYGRQEAIDLFERDLIQAISKKTGPMYEEFMRLVDLVRKGEELHLGCFCAPQACHGEVIIHWINNILGVETEAEIAVVREGGAPVSEIGGVRYFEGHITSLKENQVFVFGSNLDGEHGANAAKQAKEQFGAVEGQGSGMTGSSYAFPTKKTARGRALPDTQLQKNMDTFIEYAKAHPEKEFLLTNIGTGLAKKNILDIARMLNFSTKGVIPPNVIISKEMADIFESSKKALPVKKNMELLKLRQDVKDILAPNAIHNFTQTNRDYHFLSNMSPARFTYKGKVYGSVEQAYQSIRFTDPDIADMVAGTANGYAAKAMAKQLLKEGKAAQISFFQQRNMNIMRDLLRAKFNDNPGLKQSLLDTKDLPLVEGNVWGDDFWGVSSPSGENWLGRMLMELRGEYGGTGYVEWRKEFDPSQVYEYTPRTYPTLNGFLPEYLNENDPITFIGSRKLADATPLPDDEDEQLVPVFDKDIQRLKDIQALLNEIGTVSRSGGAGGTDEIVTKYALVGKREIYTPWYGFVKSEENKLYGGANIKDEMALDRLGNQARAYQIAKEFYPGDLSTAKEAVRKLMTRNTYQILGPDLNSPSNFVIAWTPTGEDTGGTAQALRIARAMGIPVFNVRNDDDFNAIVQYLQTMLVRKKTGYKYTPAKGDYITGPTRVKPGYRFETKGEYGDRVLGDIIEPEDAK